MGLPTGITSPLGQAKGHFFSFAACRPGPNFPHLASNGPSNQMGPYTIPLYDPKGLISFPRPLQVDGAHGGELTREGRILVVEGRKQAESSE